MRAAGHRLMGENPLNYPAKIHVSALVYKFYCEFLVKVFAKETFFNTVCMRQTDELTLSEF